MMTETTKGVQIGYINACIAGDYRYSSKLEVFLDGATAYLVLSENGATGGMDGSGGSDPFHVTRRATVQKATPALIVKAIKSTMDSTIKRYGKPSKKFVWVGEGSRYVQGLNAKNCKDAMDLANA